MNPNFIASDSILTACFIGETRSQHALNTDSIRIHYQLFICSSHKLTGEVLR